MTLWRDSVNVGGLNPSNVLRVVASALVLSTLSFAAGVAGDLSLVPPPSHGTRIVMRIPPPIPADAIRARPISLLSTASAEASPLPRRARFSPLVARTEDVELISMAKSDFVLMTALAAEESHAAASERQKGG